MSRSRPSLLPTAGGLLLVLVGLYFLTHRSAEGLRTPQSEPTRAPVATPDSAASSDLSSANSDSPADAFSASDMDADLAQKLSVHLTRPHVRAHEAVLIFKDAGRYQGFLVRAANAGVVVTGRIDAIHVMRVRVRAYDAFAADLVARAADFGGIGANAFIEMPPPPAARLVARQTAVGDTLLATLGVPPAADTSGWGKGVVIAVLDGGAVPHPSLGARLRYLDIGLGYGGTGESGQHGTAVAALAAGASPSAPGVAPAADILSIRVVDTDDKSDVFTVSQAIVSAVDAGARVLNLSLGGYSTSAALERAITYAHDHGAVVVAAAGNHGASRLTWPAADPRVVSVGATDAAGHLTAFSNSGPGLRLTAPGLGIRTAGMDGADTLFSGTSASAPLVSGAIALLMSQTPALTAHEAVSILTTYSADGGAAGPDEHYGHGILDLGRVLARDDPARVDVAVSSHHYDADAASLEVVLQNRGAVPLSQLTLTTELNGRAAVQTIPFLAPGQSLSVPLPIDADTASRPISLRSKLDPPSGATDAAPDNNTRATLIDLSGP